MDTYSLVYISYVFKRTKQTQNKKASKQRNTHNLLAM